MSRGSVIPDSQSWPGASRDDDSRQVPAPMRRDVRLLGEILGQVIREDAGQDLLDDVEDLRHRAIAARRHSGLADEAGDARTGSVAEDEIAELVAGWPLPRAEAVARAFTAYFH